ncbi:MAG: hypothetical protein IJ123_06350 [Blautia sp.]|nr:hypothetical protein [Blautia sp.]
MPVGKESIKRAAAAGRKKTTAAKEAAPKAEVKAAAPDTAAEDTQDVKASVIPGMSAETAELVEKTGKPAKTAKSSKTGIIQCFEELPVWLL